MAADASDFGTLQLLSAAAYSRSFADRGEATRVDVWIPLRADPEDAPARDAPDLHARPARTRPHDGHGTTRVRDDGRRTLESAYPMNRGRGVNVEPLAEVVLGRVRPTLYVLLGAVALVL